MSSSSISLSIEEKRFGMSFHLDFKQFSVNFLMEKPRKAYKTWNIVNKLKNFLLQQQLCEVKNYFDFSMNKLIAQCNRINPTLAYCIKREKKNTKIIKKNFKNFFSLEFDEKAKDKSNKCRIHSNIWVKFQKYNFHSLTVNSFTVFSKRQKFKLERKKKYMRISYKMTFY